MKVYLVRHGIAEDAVDASLQGRGDPLRALTIEGREKTKLVAQKFSKIVEPPEVILHSSYLRAKETAQIFHKYFDASILAEVDGVKPNDEPSDGVNLIESYSAKVRRLMIVSHEPYLGYLFSLILTGSLKHPMPFKKAGIVGFDWRGAGNSTLLFALTPKLILTK